jgi:hypothetical protein
VMQALADGIAETSNGEVRYTLNTSRSNGRFRGIIEFR